MQLADTVALVTGSSRGIGAQVADVLHRRGATVILHGRDRAALERRARELRCAALVADLAIPGAGEDLAGRARAEHGRVDVVVHNAGVGWYGDVAQMPAERLETVLRLDLYAPIELSRALLPHLRAAGRGHLSFVASIAGLTGVAGEAVYAAAKAGVVAFADSLRLELAGTGVTVSTVNPGAVATDFFAGRGAGYDRRLPRPMAPRAVAEQVVRAIERERPRTVIPRWLALAPAVRALSPSGYDALARRFG